jgi:ATP adenylyltransferase
LIVKRARHGVVILNRFPYNNGHLLVAPIAHKARLEELTTEESLDLQQTLARLTTVLTNLMKPDGFNIGLNLGTAAGAGLPGHLHWHIVPRWVGDSNFMPVLSDARVISQSLESLYDLLYPALHSA